MSWDIDKQELIDAIDEKNYEWLWSAVVCAYEERDYMCKRMRCAYKERDEACRLKVRKCIAILSLTLSIGIVLGGWLGS